MDKASRDALFGAVPATDPANATAEDAEDAEETVEHQIASARWMGQEEWETLKTRVLPAFILRENGAQLLSDVIDRFFEEEG